jgi:hypothetical protein
MGEERKIENPRNQLEPSEVVGQKQASDAGAAPKPHEPLREGRYGELNSEKEDSPEGGATEADGFVSPSR